MAQAQALAELPVIFISAYDRAEPLARALDAGADDYLVKPFSATELTARVCAARRRRAAPVRARRAGHRLPRPPRHAHRLQADDNAAAARRRGWCTGVPRLPCRDDWPAWNAAEMRAAVDCLEQASAAVTGSGALGR